MSINSRIRNHYNFYEIQLLLNDGDIKYRGVPNHKGWLDILCPVHSDRHFGNAYINVYSGVIKCFACGYVGHIAKHVSITSRSLTRNKSSGIIFDSNVFESRNGLELLDTFSIKCKEIDVDKNYYCISRNLTKDWVEYFCAKEVCGGYYDGYMVVPIYYNNNIVTYEYRKLYEYERLSVVYGSDKSLEDLRLLYKNDSNFKDSYLDKPKVLYPKNGRIVKDIIFNYDRLDKDKDLYIFEGVTSTAKKFNESKNVTCTFGSVVSNKQIELLRQFNNNKIVVIDEDLAGIKHLYRIASNVSKVYVYYENEIIDSMTFLTKKIISFINII